MHHSIALRCRSLSCILRLGVFSARAQANAVLYFASIMLLLQHIKWFRAWFFSRVNRVRAQDDQKAADTASPPTPAPANATKALTLQVPAPVACSTAQLSSKAEPKPEAEPEPELEHIVEVRRCIILCLRVLTLGSRLM